MIRLLIIAPDRTLGGYLHGAFERETDFAIVASVTLGERFAGNPDEIDVVALHAEAHNGDLMTAISRLREQLPNARIVLIHPPGIRDVQINALEAGASGYVGQGQTVGEMVQVVRTVHTHGSSIDGDLVQDLVERIAKLQRQLTTYDVQSVESDGALTEREREVLELVGQDLSDADIAARLAIPINTIEDHVHQILFKLNADSRDQLGDWFRWQQQYQASSMARDGGEMSEVSADTGWGDAPALLMRGSLLAASRLPALREMIASRLSEFCRQLGWPVGHVFLLDEATGEMASSGIWHLREPEAFARFREVTESMRFERREGIVGQILFSPQPIWVADVGAHPGYLRAAAAREAGIRSGLFLPFFDGSLIGAFEFYTSRPDQPDPATVEDIVQTGRQIGHRLEAQRDR